VLISGLKIYERKSKVASLNECMSRSAFLKLFVSVDLSLHFDFKFL